MTKPADLIDYLFDGKSTRLATELHQWMDDSGRFITFVDTYRDKIRKKIRTADDAGRSQDLRAELEVAYRLLGDRRLEVEYEPYASLKARGADFAVTYRANLVFNIEVARMRAEEGYFAEPARNEERVLRIVLEKLGQMQTNIPNLLVIHVLEDVAKTIALEELMQGMKNRADKRDASFYSHSRYSTPGEFYIDFLRLSGVLFWEPNAQQWINKQAKVGLDDKVMKLVRSIVMNG